MPISFTCPHCGTTTSVADEFAGMTGPCAHCGQTISVPGYASPETAGQSTRGRRKGWSPFLALLAVILVGSCCLLVPAPFAMLMPVFETFQDRARVAQCKSNLEQIGEAMQSYMNDHGCFPPAYLADASGKPLHSWRVLLLPYVGGDHLYQQYDFSQPWDSEKNRQLADEMPEMFACPDDEGAGDYQTSYVAVCGPGLAFDGPRSVRARDIADGTNNTVLLVETVDSAIHWMEPRDLDAAELHEPREDSSGSEASLGVESNHREVAHALKADGTVIALDANLDSATLDAMLTIAGGETVEPPKEVTTADDSAR